VRRRTPDFGICRHPSSSFAPRAGIEGYPRTGSIGTVSGGDTMHLAKHVPGTPEYETLHWSGEGFLPGTSFRIVLVEIYTAGQHW